MAGAPQKYLSPITFVAENFVKNFESLTKTYNHVDAVLVTSLQKVMNAIDSFLESNPKSITPTENTKLVECRDISHIKETYYCCRCKRDLGKSAEKVTLHLIEQCGSSGEIARQSKTNSVEGSVNKNSRKTRNDVPKNRGDCRKEVKLTKKTRSLLTNDLGKFIVEYVEIGTKLKCLPEYNEIESDLKNLIQPLFPDTIKIYKFGSRIAGIGSRESDLDFYIDIGENFNVFQNRCNEDILAKLYKVENAIKNNKSWRHLIKIDKARVPILRVIHGRTSIECDLNFSNSLGIINTKFLEYIFNIQPIARLLCIFMKKWLHRTKLTIEMSTYSVILMILLYLQTIKVLPSMKRLQGNVNLEKALTVGPWLCTYSTLTLSDLNIALQDTNHMNLLKFINGLFIFYSNFNFDTDVVCPYLGKVVKKQDLINLMPSRYIEYVKTSDDFALKLDKPIIVQDIIQLNHNTTKGLSTYTLQNFKTLLNKSLEVLNDTFLF